MADIKNKLKLLPKNPGVYLFKDAKGQVLYVGKAKVLHSRVRSYFSFQSLRDQARQSAVPNNIDSPIKSANDSMKVISKMSPSTRLEPAKQAMVAQIADLDTIACDNEIEALVLEANLIKQYQPPYNVILRDDKFYLFIKITTNEERPRVFPVRRIKKDKARYFGPYSSAASVRQTLKLLRRIFPHRGEQDRPRDIVFPHPLFTAMDSPIKSANDKNMTTYQLNIKNIIQFLQGKRQAVMETLTTGMKKAACEKNYEAAIIFRDQLRAIERLEGFQKVYLPRREVFDVISIVRQKSHSAANIFSVREGKLLNKNTFLLKHRATAASADILRQFVLQYFQVAQDIPPIIYVPQSLADEAQMAQWINKKNPPLFMRPQRGKKRQLMQMGEMNAQQLLDQESASLVNKTTAKQAVEELAGILGLDPKQTLQRIETYDISNIQGKMAVGSMVVFTDGQPDKQHYKKFKIRAGETPNDFAMLYEVLSRRFSRRHPDWPKPDLILIDGGRGQLNVAQRVLIENDLNIPMAALAKREEELFMVNNKEPVRLPFDSPALFLIQRMRDEAHRFGLAYHKLLRGKQARHSILDEIPGLGPKTKKKLLNHFGSVRGIQQAKLDELTKVIGKSRMDLLQDWL